MKIFKLSLLTIFLSLLITLPGKSLASEGIFQLEANDGTGGRCFIVSTLLADFKYKMLINCRALKYPIAENLFQYVLWADHGDDEPTRLGTLGIGKREFTAERPFSRLVVTKEANDQPEDPSQNRYMDGRIQPIAFLEGTTNQEGSTNQVSPTPQSSPTSIISNLGVGGGDDETSESEEKDRPSIGATIRVLGAIVLFVVVLVGVIAFVSASRRRPINI